MFRRLEHFLGTRYSFFSVILFILFTISELLMLVKVPDPATFSSLSVELSVKIKYSSSASILFCII